MLPKLECVKFCGVKPLKFEFKNFLEQFQNYVMHLELNKVKLTLLKSYLSNYALHLISHLTYIPQHHKFICPEFQQYFIKLFIKLIPG